MLAVLAWTASATAPKYVIAEQCLAEQECRDRLEELQRLARRGCAEELRETIHSCGTAGAAVLGCLWTRQPRVKFAVCLGAAFSAADCVHKAGAYGVCLAHMDKYASDVYRLKNGDLFCFVNEKGCAVIAQRTADDFKLLGVIDPSADDIIAAFRHFERR
jgi:hypothetical protein